MDIIIQVIIGIAIYNLFKSFIDILLQKYYEEKIVNEKIVNEKKKYGVKK